jgi:uncharacterized protein DUF5681
MSQSDPPDGKKNAAVGYGRPPVNRQFKPGQSGNPKGRPKGRKNFVTIFAGVLSRPIKVRDKDGKVRKLSKLEAMIEGVTNKGIAGNANALVKVIQLAEKHGVFKEQAQKSAAEISADLSERLAKLSERMGTHNRQPSEESKSITQQETENDAPPQRDPKIK